MWGRCLELTHHENWQLYTWTTPHLPPPIYSDDHDPTLFFSELASFRDLIWLIKWCLKFSTPGFSNTWTVSFQMFKLVLEKAEEPEVKLPTSAGSLKKQKSSRKNIRFCFTDYAKAFDCVGHNKLENSERDGNTRQPDLLLKKPVCRSGSNS